EAAAQVLKPAGPAPDRRLLGPVVAVIEAIAAHVAGKERESALVLLGWFAWWCGDNAKAHVHFQRCLAGDPGHRLALLMHEVLRVGHPPGWVLGARSGSNFRGTAGNSWGTAGNTAR
ncbi:MAG TPA: DUF4192 family protein, partial [Actinomycetaceae bacterium]|nr:DUF4192 family protein [Actinomycetaceae bacterium]